jgi:hypothetical protein
MIPAALAGLLMCAARVGAHGIASALVVYPGGADTGTFYRGYNPSYQYQKPAPQVVQWSTPDDLQNTFVPPTSYDKPDIVCHLGATPADMAIPVKGGDVLGVQWTTWPDSHKGPIFDMLANCNGPCQGVDKTKLKFFEIGQSALVDSAADVWAGNVLIKNNLTWFIKIPTAIAPGNYVLRHEIIALHAAGQVNGAQNYPFCFNLAIDTKGTDKPVGAPIEGMFSPTDPGIKFDLFARKGGAYPMPGPSLYTGALPVTQGKPGKITATGSGVMTLDEALLAPATPATPATAATPATPAIPATPAATTAAVTTAAGASPAKPAKPGVTGITTQIVTTQVTVKTKTQTTLYTTVRPA